MNRVNGQYTGPPLRKPTLYGPDGRPIYANPEHDDGFALPHVYTFASIISGAYNAYWHDRWDEALKHSRESALAMTRDASLQALVQERVLTTVNLKWHMEIEDERDLWQQAVRDGLQTMARGIPRLAQMKRYLLEGVWYGKYGSHLAWEFEERNLPDVQAFAQTAGAPATRRLTTRPRRALALKRHRPVNGDKIGHQHDGTPHVLVSASQTQSDIKGARLISTTAGGQGLVLAGNWRERFVIHQHMVDDADFMAAEEGERIHGVGIRHVVYWSWWLKQEFMEWMTRFFERSGLGVRVWYYEGGNPNSLSEVKTRAKEQDQNVNILVPIWPNRPGYSPGSFEVVDAPVAGAAALLGMIQYIDNNLERYIVGQTLSSGTEGSGLGGSGVAALHADTKYQLVAFDAGNLGETLTEDLVKVQQRWTYGHVDFPVRWVQNVDEFDPAEKLAGVQTAFSMGVDFREDEVRGLTGLSDPMPGDVTLNSIQQMAQQMAAEQVAQQGGDEYDGYGYEGDEEDGDWEGYEHPEHGPGLRNKKTGETRHGDEADEDDGPDANARTGEPWRYAGPEQLAPRLPGEKAWDDAVEEGRLSFGVKPEDLGGRKASRSGRQYLPKVNPLRPGNAEPKWEVYQAKSGEPAWRHSTTGLIHRGANPPRLTAQEVHDRHQERLNAPPRTASVAPGARESLAALMPHVKIRDDELHRLVGAQPGTSVSAHVGWGGTGINLTGEGPHIQNMHRTLGEDSQGRLTMFNNAFFLKKNAQRGGFGLKQLSDQAEHLAGLGVEQIRTTAGKGPSMNGWKSWPLMGYDAPIPHDVLQKMPSSLYQTARSVTDLMKTPEGRAFWQKHGDGMQMSFDLTPGSKSWQQLNAYRQSKGLPPIQLDAEKVHATRAARHAAVAREKWAHSLDNLGLDRDAIHAEAARLHAAHGAAVAAQGHSPRDVWDGAYRRAVATMQQRQAAPPTAPVSTLQPTAVNYGRDDFDERQHPRDDGGRFTADDRRAAGELLDAHPHPRGEREDIPGIARPDLRAKDPALQAAFERDNERTARAARARAAALVHDMIVGKPYRLTPMPPDDLPTGKRIALFKRAVEAMGGDAANVDALREDFFGKSLGAVADSHARGKDLLAKAREEAGRRYAAALERAEEHLAGLPESERGKARKLLDRAKASNAARHARHGDPTRYDFDEANHPRDDDGKFKATGRAKRAARRALVKLGESAGGVRDWAKHWAGRIGADMWEDLDEDDKALAVKIGKLAHGVEHAAMLVYRKGEALAQEAARERGLPDTHVKNVGRILTIADWVMGLTVNFPLATGLTGSPLVGKAASYLPVASMAYIAYSTARNPILTLRAARRVLSRTQVAAAHMAGDVRGMAAELLKALAGSENTDWYQALVYVALDRTHDLRAALDLAAEAAAKYPSGYFSRGKGPDRHARKKDDGRWITIGATTGEDGKKHGGCPVYIRGGKIEKGPASLTGKPLDNLRGDPSPEWKERAKAEGVDPRKLHALAKDMQRHHGEHAMNRTQMLQHARKAAGSYGVSLQGLQARNARGKLDASMIPHFDEIAASMAAAYPEYFGGGGALDAEDKLFDLLLTGNVKGLSDEDAYEQALVHLRDHTSEEPDDEPRGDAFEDEFAPTRDAETAGVPFARGGRPAAYAVEPSHEDALGGMGVGHSGRVGGVHVSRTRPDAWRVDGPSGHVEGDAAKVAAHIRQLADGRKLHGKRLSEALARAAAYDEPSFFEPDRLEANTRAFAGLPVGTPVVSVDHDAGSHGRVGRIVRDPDTGRNRVILDGESVYASNHVEPLDSALSWRLTPEERAAREAQRAAAPRQGSLFARGGLPTTYTAAEFWTYARPAAAPVAPHFDVHAHIGELTAAGFPKQRATAIALNRKALHESGRAVDPPVPPPFVPKHSHAIDLHLGPPAIASTSARGGLPRVPDIGRHLDQLHHARHGRPFDIGNPADRKRMVDAAHEEVLFQLAQPVTGEHWYSDDVKQAMKLTGRAIPQLKASKHLQGLTTAAAAVLSGGAQADSNWKNAAYAIRHHLEHGHLPMVNPESGQIWPGEQGRTNTQQLAVLQHLVNRYGEKGAVQFLMSDHMPRDLRAMQAEAAYHDAPSLRQTPAKWGFVAGEPIYKGGPTVPATGGPMPGAFILGPKKGAFFLNLNGRPEVTVDRWHVREANRHAGRIMDEGGNMRDVPDNELHREHVKQWTREIAARVNRPEQSVQAIQWYHAQNLYRRLGAQLESTSYADGARKFLQSLGHSV